MPPSARTLVEVRDALARFDLAPDEVRDIRAGRVNRHWRVAAGGRDYVLRRYTPHRSTAAVQYEHDVLRHIASRGWPVAVPLSAKDGATHVEVGSACYALFPALPGRPPPYGSHPHLQAQGQLLARLHRDLARWPVHEQRDGFGRVWELDVYAAEGHGTFDETLRVFEREHRDLARAVRRERYNSLRELARLGYGALPDTLVHADFHRDNLFFVRGRLTAALDFDLVHRDARAADVARSIASGCLVPPDHNDIDVEGVRAFVSGYVEETPLHGGEARLIVPLARAYLLWLTALRLRQWMDHGEAKALPSIARLAGARLPALDARRREIEAALGVA